MDEVQAVQRVRPDMQGGLALGTELPTPGLIPAPAPVPGLERTAEVISDGVGRVEALVTVPRLLLASDALVLAGYVVAAQGPLIWVLALWGATVAGFAGVGSYGLRLHLSALDEAPLLAGRVAAAACGTALVAAVRVGPDRATHLLVLATVGLVAHVLVRGLLYSLIRNLRRHGSLRLRTLVVGSGDVSRKLTRLLTDRSHGLDVVGHLDAERGSGLDLIGDAAPAGWRRLGEVADLQAHVKRERVQVVLVGFGQTRDDELASQLRQLKESMPAVFAVDRLFEVGSRPASVDRLGPLAVRRIRLRPLVGPRWVVKRGVDVVCAGAALALLAPVLAVIAIAVRREVGPSILFRQVRIGRDGVPFELLKFRSMLTTTSESDVRWSIASDVRVGPVGKFLRRSSLDELPQLINILRGDMTLVGPRPERPHFVTQFTDDFPHYRHRHRVPVGLTGLAQVSGLRGNTPIDDRARFDNFYIENHSLWLDVKVLLRTVGSVLVGSGS